MADGSEMGVPGAAGMGAPASGAGYDEAYGDAGAADWTGEAPTQPRIVLMGLPLSGKSSIQKVVFYKMSPHETLFLDSTRRVQISEISNSHFVQFETWDFPGTTDVTGAFDSKTVFGGCSALLFVIDAQDSPYGPAQTKLLQTLAEAYKVNKNIKFEVFIHKVDGLSDDQKVGTQRDISTEIMEDLAAEGLNDLCSNLCFHLTSIYDHSIFEAFSKVVQKLIPQLELLGSLLDTLIQSCRIEKAFLFDVVSKIYVATDSAPMDMFSYELCSEMIDVVIDVSCIYGMSEEDGTGDGLAYDSQSFSLIKLSNGYVLCLREVNKYLALVCMMQEETIDKSGLIEFNFQVFKHALEEAKYPMGTRERRRDD